MATFHGGDTVKGGYFVSVHDWKLEMVEAPWGMLPGDSTRTYRRVPLPAMLLLAPLLGLGFVLLLPFLGLAVVGELIYGRAAAAFGRRARVARTATVPRR